MRRTASTGIQQGLFLQDKTRCNLHLPVLFTAGPESHFSALKNVNGFYSTCVSTQPLRHLPVGAGRGPAAKKKRKLLGEDPVHKVASSPTYPLNIHCDDATSPSNVTLRDQTGAVVYKPLVVSVNDTVEWSTTGNPTNGNWSIAVMPTDCNENKISFGQQPGQPQTNDTCTVQTSFQYDINVIKDGSGSSCYSTNGSFTITVQ